MQGTPAIALDPNMASLNSWLRNQRPEIQKNLTSARGIDFLHISQIPTIRKMSPRIGHRQLKKEDRTIPRICGSETLVGCIYGHSSVRDNIYSGQTHNGTDYVNSNMMFYIYRLNIAEPVRPSKKLVPDAHLTKELWIVPYSPESMEVVPERMGRMLPYEITDSLVLGQRVEQNIFLVEVKKPFKIDKEIIYAGKYKFAISGDLVPQSGVQSVSTITQIREDEWRMALATFKLNLK